MTIAHHGLLMGDSSASDPYFSSVVLLMDGSSVSQDLSSYNHTITMHGTVTTSSATPPPFGTSALVYATYQAQWLSIASATEFDMGSGDFTIEAAIRTNTAAGGVFFGIIGKRASTAVFSPFTANVFNQNMTWGASNNGTSFGVLYTDNTTISQTTWYQVAFVRSGNNFYRYIDGVYISAGATTMSGALMTNATDLTIGSTAADGLTSWLGQLAAIRITKGVARYTNANYTPAAFPTH